MFDLRALLIYRESMEQTQEIETITPELIPIPDHLAPQYAVVNACLEAGLKQSDIAKGLGKSRASITYAKHQIKQKYDITTGKMMKLAFNAQKNFLQGLPVGEVRPKSSDVSAAIDRQYDRAFPKVSRSENLNVNVELNPIELDDFKRR